MPLSLKQVSCFLVIINYLLPVIRSKLLRAGGAELRVGGATAPNRRRRWGNYGVKLGATEDEKKKEKKKETRMLYYEKNKE